MRVLIVEDELRLADAIARGLRHEGIAVDVSGDGSAALVKARVVRYDVLVLDRDLPGTHGDEVCRILRGEQPDTGILMLTAADATEDLVQGLSLGADDYLAKPFRSIRPPAGSPAVDGRWSWRARSSRCWRC